MPRKQAIKQLPDEMKKELDRKLLENDFDTFERLSEWTKAQGYFVCSSTLHRHKQKLIGSNVLLDWARNIQEPGKMTEAELAREYALLCAITPRITERKKQVEIEIAARWFSPS
jgi:hypothetical protein